MDQGSLSRGRHVQKRDFGALTRTRRTGSETSWATTLVAELERNGVYYYLSYVSSVTPPGPTITRSPSCAGRIHTGIPGPMSMVACRSFSVFTSLWGSSTTSPIVTYSSWDRSCVNPVRYVRPASTLLTALTASAIPKCDVCGSSRRQSSARTGIDFNSGHTSSGMNDTSEM